MLQLQEPKLHLRENTLSDYIDISNALDSPITLFVSLKDLKDKDQNYIHLYSYSLGKERVVVWSIYSRSDEKIYFDGGCKYNSYVFTNYIKIWKSHGFQPVSTGAKDKVTDRILEYLDIDSSHKIIKTREDYKSLLLFKAWYEEKLDYNTFIELFESLNYNELSIEFDASEILESYYYYLVYRKEYNSLVDDDIDTYLQDIYRVISENILSYEKTLNIDSLIGEYKTNKELVKISKKYVDALSRSTYSSPDAMKILEECPENETNCYYNYDDETSSCAVFNYGKLAFHERDSRHYSRNLM